MLFDASRRWGAILSLHLAGFVLRLVMKLYLQHAISRAQLRAGLIATRRLEGMGLWLAFGRRRGSDRRQSTGEFNDRVD